MPSSIASLITSFQLLWSRKTRWPLILGPVLFGIILYSSFFYLAYDFIGQKLQPWLMHAFHIDQMGFFVKWMLFALITVIGLFLMNWTFVLVVSLFAAPFNDFLSESIADELQGKPLKRDRAFWSELFPFIWNETKKVSVIVFFSFIAFFISFVPVLIPLSLWISFLLIAAQFSDYSWVRNKLSTRECIKNITSNLFSHTLAGGIFFLLISVPIINLLVPAWATSHFTLLYVRNTAQ